jgi:hypothetical protein
VTAYVTVETQHGNVTLPAAQAVGIAEAVSLVRARGVPATWHPADCGCCYVVHERDAACLTGGYVVGRDGTFDWYDTA